MNLKKYYLIQNKKANSKELAFLKVLKIYDYQRFL